MPGPASCDGPILVLMAVNQGRGQAAYLRSWEIDWQGQPCQGTLSEAFRDLRHPMHRCLHALTHGMA